MRCTHELDWLPGRDLSEGARIGPAKCANPSNHQQGGGKIGCKPAPRRDAPARAASGRRAEPKRAR